MTYELLMGTKDYLGELVSNQFEFVGEESSLLEKGKC